MVLDLSTEEGEKVYSFVHTYNIADEKCNVVTYHYITEFLVPSVVIF